MDKLIVRLTNKNIRHLTEGFGSYTYINYIGLETVRDCEIVLGKKRGFTRIQRYLPC